LREAVFYRRPSAFICGAIFICVFKGVVGCFGCGSAAREALCSTNMSYRVVLARFFAAIFLARFRARSCEAFVPLGFLLSEDHGITGASSRNERFGFVILDFGFQRGAIDRLGCGPAALYHNLAITFFFGTFFCHEATKA
jgi:hypothetical protein